MLVLVGDALRIAAAAFLLVEHPGRVRRRRLGDLAVDGLVGIADRRPDDPAVCLDLILHERRTVVRHRQEAAEFLLRIVDQHRKEDFAFVGDDHRLVVGDQLGEERHEEEDEENPQRPVAATVGLEVFPAAAVDRRSVKRARRGGGTWFGNGTIVSTSPLSRWRT
jgi:hypothetical protein